MIRHRSFLASIALVLLAATAWGSTETFIQLPADGAGKKTRQQSRTVGANTVYTPFVHMTSMEQIVGVYDATMALQSVQASAQDATATGFAWLQNPVGNTKNVRLRKLELAFTQVATESDHATAPRIVAARFTFTGTASGATVTAGKKRTSHASATADVRTAVTGMTVSLGALMRPFMAPGILITTSGLIMPLAVPAPFAPTDEEEFIVLAAGEGIVLYQPDNGTASDGRRFTVAWTWDEYTP
jgi:hypothetical protein